MPLLQKLLIRILQLKFVEISDLLPETWISSIEDMATPYSCGTTNAKKKVVTNIFTWLQGYASLVSTLHKISHHDH